MVIRLTAGEDFTVHTKSGGQFKLPDAANGTVEEAATTAFVQAALAGVIRVDPETGNIYYTTPDSNA